MLSPKIWCQTPVRPKRKTLASSTCIWDYIFLIGKHHVLLWMRGQLSVLLKGDGVVLFTHNTLMSANWPQKMQSGPALHNFPVLPVSWWTFQFVFLSMASHFFPITKAEAGTTTCRGWLWIFHRHILFPPSRKLCSQFSKDELILSAQVKYCSGLLTNAKGES